MTRHRKFNHFREGRKRGHTDQSGILIHYPSPSQYPLASSTSIKLKRPLPFRGFSGGDTKPGDTPFQFKLSQRRFAHTRYKQPENLQPSKTAGGRMADVFQLSLFLGIREAQVFAQLVRNEFYKSAQDIFDEAVMPLMISHIAAERGVDTSQVELLLVNEAWDRMIADRYLRKWPSADVSHNPLRKQLRAEPLREESAATVGA